MRAVATENTHFGAARIREMTAHCRSFFFIGVGGVNMSSLALITKRRGYRVGGSDRTESAVTRRLACEGIEVFYSHEAAHIDTYDAVVYTVAISPDNPEYVRAKERGIPLISRADYLGYLMTDYKNRVGLSGMHGKSTTTSMCAEVFMRADTDPTVLSGAAMRSMGGAYRIGGTEHFIFEACEYMDSFLDFYPSIAVLLNIEMDHVDYFKSMAHIERSFRAFAEKTGKDGFVVANGDDAHIRSALAGYAGRVIWFSGTDANADFYATDVETVNGCPHFDIVAFGKPFCRVSLKVTGQHNIYNALATAAAAHLCGVDGEDVARGLASFSGAQRRMEYKGNFQGAAVYDDYGHHPTEVKTTLEGAAAMGHRRTVCVFQSHTYSRTVGLFEEFCGAFGAADEVILADIYAAREIDTGEVSGKKLAEALPNGKYVGDMDAIVAYLRQTLAEGDLLIVMGAGDIYKIFEKMGLEE
ncbi:MAG: UDP-N-acetylmuramate--L-alanine ligase [Ruminococcaceae bacterium]|nr:UDP-N-acetylmuramate--L-alanine ligase [Oscillospiraceae bacterium]